MEGVAPQIKILCNDILVLNFRIQNIIGYDECERFWGLDSFWLTVEKHELVVQRRKAPGGGFFLFKIRQLGPQNAQFEDSCF